MMPSPHVIRIPQRILPLIFLTTKIPVMIIPANARITVIPTLLKEASTPFALLYASTENNWSNVEPPTTICAFCKPTNAIKRPIPTLTADFRFIGIALKIASRTFVRERRMKIIPSANTAVSAYCQVYPIPITTV